MKRIRSALLAPTMCLMAATTLPGCISLQKVPDVVHDVASEILRDAQEAQQIVEVLHALTTSYFLLHADPAMQANVEHAFAVVALALDAAVRASAGAKATTDKEYDLAFANFRAAYLDLVAMLKSLGIVTPDSDKMGAMKSSRGRLALPEPRAVHTRDGFQ